MGFSYDASLVDDISRVRQSLGDTVDAGHLVEDETISYYLGVKSSELAVAYQLALDLMARFATAIDSTVDGQGVKASQRYAQFKNLATQLSQQLAAAPSPATGGLDYSGIGVFGATAQEVIDGRCDDTAPANLPPGSTGIFGRGWR